MGTWISHLRIAAQLWPRLPGVDEAALAYGSLAPDSGLPNADWTAFDPPKTVTHFLHPGEGEEAIRDDVFYRQYLAPVDAAADRVLYSFRLGYWVHLLCDSLWSKKIVATTAQAFAGEIQADPKKAFGRIKYDWYSLDQVYVHGHRAGLFWRVLVETPNPRSELPFISEAAFHHQLDYLRHFYSQPEAHWLTPRPYPYLNEATMTRWVDDSVALVLEVLAARPRVSALPTGDTALALLPAGCLQPYPAPLGD